MGHDLYHAYCFVTFINSTEPLWHPFCIEEKQHHFTNACVKDHTMLHYRFYNDLHVSSCTSGIIYLGLISPFLCIILGTGVNNSLLSRTQFPLVERYLNSTENSLNF